MSDSDLLVGRAFNQTYYRENRTESYVEVPPACIITLSDGTTFRLGEQFTGFGGWNMEFNVLANDRDTGHMAQRIEMRNGVVKIFGRTGWRTWSRKHRNFV